MKKQLFTNTTKTKKEAGFAIIEGLVVYPIAFVILALLLLLSDVFYQRAWVELAVAQASERAANKMADPSRRTDFACDGAVGQRCDEFVPVEDGKTLPYRFLDKNASFPVMYEVRDKLSERVGKGDASLFGFKPNVYAVNMQRYDDGPLTAEVIAKISYNYNIPIFSSILDLNPWYVGSTNGALATASSIGEKIRTADYVESFSSEVNTVIVPYNIALEAIRAIMGWDWS